MNISLMFPVLFLGRNKWHFIFKHKFDSILILI